MTAEVVTDLMRNSLYIAMMLVCVIIVPSLMVGLVVSMFQAATQINEQTLSFLPRLIVTLSVLAYTAPWLGNVILEFTIRLLTDIPSLIR
ncbi:flagellar export apparatus protein FliQ [Gammaproteobacteria bacterium 42_54_T18]|nr:flagellar export apparatus protein FliQ [Gammaproteobacteria bacterium 42_54_T18]